MAKIVGYLGYNYKNDRYGILISDLWQVDGLHCGVTLEFYDRDTDTWLVDRIEYYNDWYLVYSGKKGAELEGLKVRY